MALGLYTVLPVGRRWNEAYEGLLAPALPAVGLALGGLWFGLASLFSRWMPRSLAAAAMAMTLPCLTGFLHLDGFMDVADAMLSSRPREEKLRILKDPHAGSFAVIALAGLLLLKAGACYGILEKGRALAALVCLPLVSRAGAALALMCIPPMAQSGYGRMNHHGASPAKKWFCAICMVAGTMVMFVFDWRSGAACLAAMAGFAASCAWALKGLGGMNGDIAGWSISCAEMAGLAVLACL